jgi:CheY-like chemotaxis protein
MTEHFLPILAAEDEESDRMILELAFEKARSPHPLILVRDGQEAIDYLSGKGHYADRSAHPLPALIVLDLKMPRMNGFDVLAWLTRQPQYKELPAVVLSSSADQSDVAKARQLGARDYFVKPHRLDNLVAIAQQIQVRWLASTQTTTGPRQ